VYCLFGLCLHCAKERCVVVLIKLVQKTQFSDWAFLNYQSQYLLSFWNIALESFHEDMKNIVTIWVKNKKVTRCHGKNIFNVCESKTIDSEVESWVQNLTSYVRINSFVVEKKRHDVWSLVMNSHIKSCHVIPIAMVYIERQTLVEK